jgi:hypothetical protein
MNAAQIKTFITAGKAVFTLQSVKSGTHFTYRLSSPKGKDVVFANVLTSPDVYTYAGLVASDRLVPTKASKIGPNAPSFKALDWFLRNLDSDQVVFRHEGKCGKCGRALTTPESIDRGIGPECASKMGL